MSAAADLDLRQNLSQITLSPPPSSANSAAMKIDSNLRNSNNSTAKNNVHGDNSSKIGEEDLELHQNSPLIRLSPPSAAVEIKTNLQFLNSTGKNQDRDNSIHNSNNYNGDEDLELRQINSPQIRLSPLSAVVEIETNLQPQNSAGKNQDGDNSNHNLNNNRDEDLELPLIRSSPPSAAVEIGDDTNIIIDNNSNANIGENNGEVCRTPTSAEHKIPQIKCCPPAPRKPRRTISCKRKLEFFEIIHREEVDEFFRSSFDFISKRSRCI